MKVAIWIDKFFVLSQILKPDATSLFRKICKTAGDLKDDRTFRGDASGIGADFCCRRWVNNGALKPTECGTLVPESVEYIEGAVVLFSVSRVCVPALAVALIRGR